MHPWQLCIAVPMLLSACTNEDIPPDRLMSRNGICLEPQNWARVVDYTRQFGIRHDLQFEGGAERFDGEGLNVAAILDERWFNGPDFALWMTSDSFRKNAANFSAISAETMTADQRALAERYLSGLEKLECRAPQVS